MPIVIKWRSLINDAISVLIATLIHLERLDIHVWGVAGVPLLPVTRSDQLRVVMLREVQFCVLMWVVYVATFVMSFQQPFCPMTIMISH
jgi:hypothetical protein